MESMGVCARTFGDECTGSGKGGRGKADWTIVCMG